MSKDESSKLSNIDESSKLSKDKSSKMSKDESSKMSKDESSKLSNIDESSKMSKDEFSKPSNDVVIINKNDKKPLTKEQDYSDTTIDHSYGLYIYFYYCILCCIVGNVQASKFSKILNRF